MAKSKTHAVTVVLTDDHLRKMIDDHLIKEEDIGDRVKVARIVQKLLNGALDLPDEPFGMIGRRDLSNRCSDMRCFCGFLGSRTQGAEMGLSRREAADLAAYIATLK